MYDQLNDFGVLTAAGDFPNILDLGEAGIERMTVDLKLPAGPVTASTALTLSLKECDSETGTYTTLVTGPAAAVAVVNGGGYSLPVPRGHKRFLKAALTGTISAGSVRALVNSYLGK
jgi:carbon monoxide dehydrogenase subunit G